MSCTSGVLIETLWNVKLSPDVRFDALSCINRNIVECKDNKGKEIKLGNDRINRNIVECKEARHM